MNILLNLESMSNAQAAQDSDVIVDVREEVCSTEELLMRVTVNYGLGSTRNSSQKTEQYS